MTTKHKSATENPTLRRLQEKRPLSPTLSSESITSSVLEELQQETNLNTEDFQELLNKFKDLSNGKKELDKESFLKIMTDTLAEKFGEHMLPAFNRVYEVFDTDGNGSIDFVELATGISTLLHGNDKDLVRMMFGLIDVSGDGNVQQEEMIWFFKKYYVGQAKVNGYHLTRQRWLALQEHLKRTFIASDLDHNGQIDFEEFLNAVSDPDHPLGMIWFSLRSPEKNLSESSYKLHMTPSNLPPPSAASIKPTKFV